MTTEERWTKMVARHKMLATLLESATTTNEFNKAADKASHYSAAHWISYGQWLDLRNTIKRIRAEKGFAPKLVRVRGYK